MDDHARQPDMAKWKGRIASALCLLPALYCAGIVGYALLNFDDYATARPQFIRYIAVPGIIALLFISVARFGSRERRVSVGGMGIALLLGLFAFEAKLEAQYLAAVTGLVEAPPSKWARAGEGNRGMPPAYTVKKLNAELGVQKVEDAVLTGIPGQQVMLCTEGGKPISYRADRYGFRNPDAVHDAPVEHVVLGDSFVEGICLPNGRDLVGQVRALGPATVGLGTRGAGPLLELAILGRFGPEIRPKHVIFVFYEGNDWHNLEREMRLDWLTGSLSSNASFGPAILPDTTRQRAASSVDAWWNDDATAKAKILKKTKISRNFVALHQTWTQLGLGYPRVASRLPVYNQVLARAGEIAGGWGGKVTILYLPQTSRLVGLIPDTFVYDQIRGQVLDAARRNRMDVVDLTPVFMDHPDRVALFSANGHLSEAGTALAAKTLGKALLPDGKAGAK